MTIVKIPMPSFVFLFSFVAALVHILTWYGSFYFNDNQTFLVFAHT